MMFKAKSSGRDGISRGGCVGSGGVDGLTAAVLVEEKEKENGVS